MAQLSTILSSILRDMIVAQHQANMYAVSLEDVYRKNGRLEKFTLPSIALGEMELDIRYGVLDDSGDTGQQELNYPMLKDLTKEICDQTATILTDTLSVELVRLKSDVPAEDNPFMELTRQPKIKRKFRAFLSRKLMKQLQHVFTQLIGAEGNIRIEEIQKVVASVVSSEIIGHEALDSFFDTPDEESAHTELGNTLQEAVNSVLPTLLAHKNMMRKRLFPSMDVTVNASELEKLPEESIHTLHIRINPKELNLYLNETEE